MFCDVICLVIMDKTPCFVPKVTIIQKNLFWHETAHDSVYVTQVTN